ncbi:uncharacterized protein BO66DRAFT_443267 [Aspergillus aculeatinus CBS 121060]|uniref:Uncharacterized protein n=1 Tax=Aspergillus aculeatinus CBS 121060 TaxID=1448322 RepID=A0ACD1GVB2_9EURO|nr:hypothetical protein BO66DRAFT_443267 [Aspergillus aculeatinus CBS 121060]RAH65272.1 hypothetical protein BO66DRAFT_443267 [Aspergillus aculeatinus CBS 121060]
MKWTPENMNILWETLFETHNLTIDIDKMATVWPNDDEKPTARAIKERLEKFRRNLKNGGSTITFSMGGKRANTESPEANRVKKRRGPVKKYAAGNGETGGDEGGAQGGDEMGLSVKKEEEGELGGVFGGDVV